MEDYLRIGIIANTHGLKGETKIFATTDDLDRFDMLEYCMADTGNGLVRLDVEGVKYFKKSAILKFKGIDSIDEAEKYKGMDILVDREHAIGLEENEYFIADLIGLAVFEEDGGLVGTLADVIQTGANDVFVVMNGDKDEILLPYIEECILDIDLEGRRMTVRVMPGLRDI